MQQKMAAYAALAGLILALAMPVPGGTSTLAHAPTLPPAPIASQPVALNAGPSRPASTRMLASST